MNPKDSPLDVELRSIQSRLLVISSGRERQTAAQLFGMAAVWSMQLGVSEKALVDKVFELGRKLDSEHL